MIININQTITNLLTEDRQVKESRTIETYLLTPASGKVIINKKTGQVHKDTFSIGSKARLVDFEEIYPPESL